MIRTLVFALMIIGAFYAGFISPFGALLAYIWFGLFRPAEWVWIDISQFRLSLILGIILIVRCISSGNWPNLSHRLSIGIMVFLGTGLVAHFNAIKPDLSWHWLDYFARLSLVSLLLVSLINSQKRFVYTIIVISSSLGFYTLKAGIIALLSGGTKFADGLAGAFIDNNAYAIVCVMIIPLLLAVADNFPTAWHLSKIISLGYRCAAVLTSFVVVSTFSRSGFLALTSAVIIYIIFHQQRSKIFGVMISIGIFVILFVPIPEGYIDRLQTITTYNEIGEESAISRIHFWHVAWNMALDNPFGVGMHSFNAAYDRYDFLFGRYGHSRSVHNSHLQTLAENGFLGFSVWIWLFFSSLNTCLNIRRFAKNQLAGTSDGRFFETMAGALVVSMVAFVVGGSFIAMALNDVTWLTFGLVASLDRLSIKAKEAQRTLCLTKAGISSTTITSSYY